MTVLERVLHSRRASRIELLHRSRSVILGYHGVGRAPFLQDLSRLTVRPSRFRAQIQLLAYEQSELTIRQNLFLASVALIQDLGGGWDVNQVPTQRELKRDFVLLPRLPPNRSGPLVPAENAP